MEEVNGKSLRFRQQLLQLVIIERRFILALYKATEKERGERWEEKKRSRRLRNRHRGLLLFPIHQNIFLHNPSSHLSYIAGSFYRDPPRWLSLVPLSIFVQLFYVFPATPIWRSNVVVFAVIRIILATCKSERKTLLCSLFWMDSYINTVPFSCRRRVQVTIYPCRR